MTVALVVSVGFTFIVGVFMLLPIEERLAETKHLLLRTGLRPSKYWIAYYSLDVFIYLILVLIAACFMILFVTLGRTGFPLLALVVIMVVFLLYGINAIIYGYLLSQIFATVGNALTWLWFSNLLIGEFTYS